MSDTAQLDSAAAVVWCEYFHPGRAWKPSKGSAPMAYATVERELSGTQMVGVTITDFNEIHSAAAVLAERGHGQRLGVHLARVCCFSGGGVTHFLKLAEAAAAPADAWARAILQTVREVSK